MRKYSTGQSTRTSFVYTRISDPAKPLQWQSMDTIAENRRVSSDTRSSIANSVAARLAFAAAP